MDFQMEEKRRGRESQLIILCSLNSTQQSTHSRMRYGIPGALNNLLSCQHRLDEEPFHVLRGDILKMGNSKGRLWLLCSYFFQKYPKMTMVKKMTMKKRSKLPSLKCKATPLMVISKRGTFDGETVPLCWSQSKYNTASTACEDYVVRVSQDG